MKMHKLESIANTDIYLIDQILKNRFHKNDRILDAGCGSGRNLSYFLNHDFDIYGIDSDKERISKLQHQYGKKYFMVGNIESLPFNDNKFNFTICNAVLHFSESKISFFKQFSELMRTLKPNGILFIRMTSIFGIEHKVEKISSYKYKLPDKSIRFLLTKEILTKLERQFNFNYLEPLKTVNVNDLRCMSTLVIKKS